MWLKCSLDAGVGVGVVSVTVKRPALLPCAADGCARNPLHYYYYCSEL